MRRLAATIALTLTTVGIAGAAQAGVLPGPVHGTSLARCTYTIQDAQVTVTGHGNARVRVVVTNTPNTRVIDYRDYLTNGTWTHGVYVKYTALNVRAWVDGKACRVTSAA